MYPVNQKTVSALIRLNQRFYTACAQSFGQTRTDSTRELDPAIPLIRTRSSLLDIGCGNGRLQRRYHELMPRGIYVGIDFSNELIEEAKRSLKKRFSSIDLHATFIRADITSPGWRDVLRDHLGARIRFSVVSMLAVIHHIPSHELRRRTLKDVSRFLKPDGILILSTWQFAENERMRRKIVDPECVDIDPRALDPGDYILSWRRESLGFRYCRHIDDSELRSLASSCNLGIDRTFRAGGKEGNLSLFGILRHDTE